jgi:DNA-binding transcriptional LysR family regulator
MEFRALRCFVAVAEELHFGRAAARLNISQPALTQQIKRLEGELGVLLFDRNRRSVKLNQSGVALMVEAQAILLQIERTTNVVKRAQHAGGGHIRIGFVPSALVAGVAKVFHAARVAMPEVTETWIEINSAEQIVALQQERIDVGLAHTPLDYGAMKAFPLIREPLVIALPEAHPAALAAQIRLSALNKEEFVISPREGAPGYYDMVQAIFSEAGFRPRVAHQARHLFALINLVSVGLGLALVPSSFKSLTVPGVVFREIEGLQQLVELSVMWNPQNESPAVAGLLDLLRRKLPDP